MLKYWDDSRTDRQELDEPELQEFLHDIGYAYRCSLQICLDSIRLYRITTWRFEAHLGYEKLVMA
jgi:hypothetical protein